MSGMGLGLGLGLGIKTNAAPKRVINLSKAELEELKSHIDDSVVLEEEELKIELLRVIDALLANRLSNTDYERLIVNLQSYKYALEHDRDETEAIRSALLGEFMRLADQAGGKHRRKTKRGRSRRNRSRRR